jgi:hypothetical protein
MPCRLASNVSARTHGVLHRCRCKVLVGAVSMRFAVRAFAEASVREADQVLGKRFEVKPDTLPKPKPQEAVHLP